MRSLVAVLLLASAARADLTSAARSAVQSGNLAAADQFIHAYAAKNGPNPELAVAVSWMARDLLDSGLYVEADSHAAEARKYALAQLGPRKLDTNPDLALALGASIEVHAQALARQGRRSEAVAFLNSELPRWKDTSIQPRIQKNLNLLTLEGHPAPAIAISQWTGTVQPQPLSALRGHPVLLFFWAHWCSDCKAEAPIIQALNAKYGQRGLKIVAPTMRYGYAAGGEEATPAQEDAWIEATRKRYYSIIGAVPTPISEETLFRYGVSTTPTLVLVDSGGVVRLYHPGAMPYEELASQIEKLFSKSSPTLRSQL